MDDNVIGPAVELQPPTVVRFRTYSTTSVFIVITLAIIFAWTLIALWTRVIENMAYSSFHLDGNSFWHALIVAAAVTIIFIATVWIIDAYQLLPVSLEPIIEGGGRPVVGGHETVAAANTARQAPSEPTTTQML